MATEGPQSESQWDLGVHLGSKMTPKWSQNGVQNDQPSNIAESVIFTTPHAYRQGSRCPKGSKNGSKFDQKSCQKVMSKPTLPKDHRFEVPGSPEERKGPKNVPKGIPHGPPEIPKTSQNGFQKRSWNTPYIKGGPQVAQVSSGGSFWEHFRSVFCICCVQISIFFMDFHCALSYFC